MTTTQPKKPRSAKKKPASPAPAPAPAASSKVLVLRTCTPGMTGVHENSKHFVWPTSGQVECPDWNPEPVCGGGLHGLAWGDGDGGLLRDEIDSKWLAVEVEAADLVKIDESKVKFLRGTVVYCGDKAGAITRVLCGRGAMERAQAAAMKGTAGQIASGYGSTAASSGDCSTAASSGDYSKAASSGYGSKAASSGYGSKAASSGDCSKAASSGDGSTAASSGDYSKAASSGNRGIGASIGSGGLAAAGANGLVIVTWWDAPAKRHRACVGEVGVGGIEADTWYGVENGKLVARGKVSA